MSLSAFVTAPRRTLGSLECSDGTSPRYAMSSRGCRNRRRSPSSAISPTAVTNFPPRSAWSAATPGKSGGSPLLTLHGPSAVSGPLEARAIQYGLESPATISWDDDATARMKRIPAFVRGMVVKAVEDSCRKGGLDRVTVAELERIRARMPTPKLFG